MGVALGALVGLAPSAPAVAGYGGGYGGTSGSAIWSLAWWSGNPEGPGPYTGMPASGVDLCTWHDVGPTTTDLGDALAEASLPESFWTEPLSGGHPGIWGVMAWATGLYEAASAGDHFDLVACPKGDEVPANGGDVESALPRAHPPSGGPVYLWVYFDTVADPPASSLPAPIQLAYSELALPAPVLHTSPSEVGGTADATLVNLDTWVWIDRQSWAPVVVTASAGPVVATVWATPAAVTWRAGWDFTSPAEDPEDATSPAPEAVDLTCDGPGEVYRPGTAGAGDCSIDFAESTLGTWQDLRATVTWTVHWAVAAPSGIVGGEGELPSLETSGSRPLRVMQIESVISSG